MRIMDIKAGAKTYRNKIIVHAIKQDLIPYFLRHTYATQLAEKGVDIKTAQYLLGHSNIAMTANIYTHVTQKMIDQAREKINA
jgi:site-specific recombinase XerD